MQARSGIYSITHIDSGKAYVGSSCDIERRWRDHRRSLTGGKHHSAHLQRAWNKYGLEAFSFAILEEVADVALLAERETHYIDLLRSHHAANGYNTAPVGGSTRGVKLGPHSADHRRKIGEGNKGKTVGDYARQRSSEVHRGKAISPEHRLAVARAAAARIHSPTTRAKLSAAAANISEETRRKRSESMKAKITPERRAAMMLTATNASEETRAKRSESLKRYWAAKRQASPA